MKYFKLIDDSVFDYKDQNTQFADCIFLMNDDGEIRAFPTLSNYKGLTKKIQGKWHHFAETEKLNPHHIPTEGVLVAKINFRTLRKETFVPRQVSNKWIADRFICAFVKNYSFFRFGVENMLQFFADSSGFDHCLEREPLKGT